MFDEALDVKTGIFLQDCGSNEFEVLQAISLLLADSNYSTNTKCKSYLIALECSSSIARNLPLLNEPTDGNDHALKASPKLTCPNALEHDD
jgi:hypothetical protein